MTNTTPNAASHPDTYGWDTEPVHEYEPEPTGSCRTPWLWFAGDGDEVLGAFETAKEASEFAVLNGCTAYWHDTEELLANDNPLPNELHVAREAGLLS